MSNQFHESATYLFRECFEGREPGNNYTWFVEGLEGIFYTLDQVDAARASTKPTERCNSIVGHAYHMLFAMRGANAQCGGKAPEGTWEDSWKKQEANEDEWAQLKADLRAEYDSFIRWYAANEDWSPEHLVMGSLALLPHMAFHLGAINQLVRIV